MENSNKPREKSLKKVPLCLPYDANPEVVSIDECKKYLGKFELSDEKIAEIRNYLIGIVDKSINSYLDDFR